jgi:hypothetical protein
MKRLMLVLQTEFLLFAVRIKMIFKRSSTIFLKSEYR